jgi:hypothetical protein
MEALVFSRREVEALARKLDSLQHELSVDERALLVAVFAAAKERVIRIQPKGPGESEPTSADLKEQLLRAFLPAEGDEFALGFTYSITGDPVHR